MNLDDVLARIPYLALHPFDVVEVDGARIRLRCCRAVKNHVGTLHAGALFTTAETAAGIAAWRVVPDDRAAVLLRGATVRYTRRAESDVVAIARVEPARAATAREAFDAAGRADVVVAIHMTDARGEPVFDATFDYALRPRRPS